VKKKFETPKVETKSQAELDTIIASIHNTALPESTKTFVENCIRLACWFPTLLEKQHITMRKLREMIFGKKKKRKKSSGNNDSNSSSGDEGADNGNTSADEKNSREDNSSDSENEPDTTSTEDNKKDAKPKGKNKGRNPHTVYEGAEIEWHTLEDIQPGSPCPENLCTGKLSALPAGVIVVVDGQPITKVTKHFVEKYRCGLCGYRIEAKAPEELEGKQKVYTPELKAYLAMHKFFLAVPYHRMDSYQKMLNQPLPDSTQWNLIEALASSCYPVFNYAKILAANSKIIWNDDTVNRILEVIAENKRGENARTGMYTTCIMAETEDGHKIALYLNGTQHSGENVEDVLKKREEGKEPIIQMSDALAANTPATIATIACYCLSHGFRKIEYLDDYFPLPCMSIMKKLGEVFEFDAKTREMTDDERLEYHIEHSKPIMFALYEQILDLLSSKDVEPNGELAKALRYFQNHWVELTRFLSVAGAPIDNNIVERALKLAIRVRKNSLFYKSRYSAALSGMLISLIYTCTYAHVNPATYLTALQKNEKAVTKNPEHWLPWNFEKQLEKLTPHSPIRATALATGPPRVNPVVAQSAIRQRTG
jgi:transposase